FGRTHAPGKGLSQSALPYHHSVPTWLKLTSDNMKEQIYKLSKKLLQCSPSSSRAALVFWYLKDPLLQKPHSQKDRQDEKAEGYVPDEKNSE
uniref:Small ribosomal subunit protein uS15 N-terminal domain-containing protein n=1 Tax=Phocoena sinus TaxID=42100 RepID=A0A8C9DWK4_PHOSS